jgi:hypothetical protein
MEILGTIKIYELIQRDLIKHLSIQKLFSKLISELRTLKLMCLNNRNLKIFMCTEYYSNEWFR